jgi:hypothetical protein
MAAGHKSPGNGWNSDDRHGQQGESTRHHGESGGNVTSHRELLAAATPTANGL